MKKTKTEPKTRTLEELVESIKALSPEERRDRAREAARARLRFERRRQKANLRRVSRD